MRIKEVMDTRPQQSLAHRMLNAPQDPSSPSHESPWSFWYPILLGLRIIFPQEEVFSLHLNCEISEDRAVSWLWLHSLNPSLATYCLHDHVPMLAGVSASSSVKWGSQKGVIIVLPCRGLV